MTTIKNIHDIEKHATLIFSKENIDAALDKMAESMNKVLCDENPIMLVVMVGGLIPAGHLLTRLNFPLQVDYIHATRYRGETRGGDLHWRIEPSISLENRNVVVIDDILDKGVTLASIVDYCTLKKANKVYSAVMVDKIVERDAIGVEKADFTGLEVENRFVYGFGLDYSEYLRNCSGIYAVAPQHQ